MRMQCGVQDAAGAHKGPTPTLVSRDSMAVGDHSPLAVNPGKHRMTLVQRSVTHMIQNFPMSTISCETTGGLSGVLLQLTGSAPFLPSDFL